MAWSTTHGWREHVLGGHYCYSVLAMPRQTRWGAAVVARVEVWQAQHHSVQELQVYYVYTQATRPTMGAHGASMRVWE